MEPMMTEDDVASYLKMSKITLANWRWKGIGPRYQKVGGKLIRYRKEDVDAWVKTRG